MIPSLLTSKFRYKYFFVDEAALLCPQVLLQNQNNDIEETFFFFCLMAPHIQLTNIRTRDF